MRLKMLCRSLMIACLPICGHAATNIDDALGKIHSLQADFTQKIVQSQQVMQEASGQVTIAEPNRFRWQINSPNSQLFVSDGKQVWNDEQDLNQVTVSPLNISLSATPLLLLSGRVDDIKQVFIIKDLGHGSYEFTPKAQDELVKKIILKFAGNSPVNLTVINGVGQVTQIHFYHVKINPTLDPSLFTFKPGPNDDVLVSS